ncbi:MAG: efflux RND transporter periplasmic adaptor subunit [Pseudomonadota bacterium]|nr:efflux RND transporter periplasmic adaptor subunit [Pseudomonadota bacterium]
MTYFSSSTRSGIALVCRIAILQTVAGLAPAIAHAAAPAPPPSAPMVLHQGTRLVVPASSPLRGRLAVSEVEVAATPHHIDLPAVVEADPARTVNVLTPATGHLLALKVGLGDAVRRGQLLAVIAAPDLAQADADAAKARDALALARQGLARAQGVQQVGANATKDLEAAQSSYNQAEAEDSRARSRLRTLAGSSDPAGVHSGPLRLTAPIAGTVVALDTAAGAFLNDPNAPLLTLTNTDRVWVTVQVPENLLGSVRPGVTAQVRLQAYPDRPLQGQVHSVSPLLDPDTRRAKARIEFPNPDGRLKPNMFAVATLAVPQERQVSVPSSALLMNNDAVTVFVEVAPWTFERRTVELGAEDRDRVRIATGLQAGQRVVTRGGILLND